MRPEPVPKHRPRLSETGPEEVVIVWSLRAAIALLFIWTGLEKFSDAPTSQWVPIFHRIGFGTWFRYFTGVVEIGGGVLFLVPRATWVAAAALAATMLGATLAHLTVLGDPVSSVITVMILAGVVGVAARVTEPRRME